MEPTTNQSGPGTAVQRSAASVARPLAPPGPVVEAEALELERLERQERAARTEYLRRRQLAGPHAHPVSVFRHVVGPDGRGYLREVDVQFDLLTHGDDPEATVEKAQAVRRAALAGDFPDQQDLMTAAHASLLLALARARQRGASEASPNAASRPGAVSPYAPEAADAAQFSAQA